MSAEGSSTVIERWCRAVAQRPEGRVLLRNLLYDLERRRLPRPVVRRLFEHLAEHMAGDAETELGARQALSWIEDFCHDHPDGRCRGQDRPKGRPSCSRVIDEESCLRFNFRPEFYGLPAEDELPAWFFDEVSRRPLDEGGLRGEMTTRRGFTWVTHTPELKALADDPRGRTPAGASSPTADDARRRLGLSHLSAPMRLLAIHYPDDAPWSCRHGAPTAIEGGASAVFRSRQREDGWGRAIDLASLGDGLPELTHEAIPFDTSFRLEPLGPLAPQPAPSPEALANATAPMSEGWLEASIERLERHRREALVDPA